MEVAPDKQGRRRGLPGYATINDVDSVKGQGSLPSGVLKQDRHNGNLGLLSQGSSCEEELGWVP